MTTHNKRLKRNIIKNHILDRELDFLPSTINRDDVREIARRYGPLRRRSAPARILISIISFFLRYGMPLAGMVAGAEYSAAKALYPLMGKEQHFGESLRFFLGQDLSQRIKDTNQAFKVAGALVSATPEIVASALYGAVIGIVAYYVLKWMLALAGAFRRRRKLTRKISELLA